MNKVVRKDNVITFPDGSIMTVCDGWAVNEANVIDHVVSVIFFRFLPTFLSFSFLPFPFLSFHHFLVCLFVCLFLCCLFVFILKCSSARQKSPFMATLRARAHTIGIMIYCHDVTFLSFLFSREQLDFKGYKLRWSNVCTESHIQYYWYDVYSSLSRCLFFDLFALFFLFFLLLICSVCLALFVVVLPTQ